MALMSDGMCGATELACNDDYGSLHSLITGDVTEGWTYQIFVGAYSTGTSGTPGAVLNITEGCP